MGLVAHCGQAGGVGTACSVSKEVGLNPLAAYFSACRAVRHQVRKLG